MVKGDIVKLPRKTYTHSTLNKQIIFLKAQQLIYEHSLQLLLLLLKDYSLTSLHDKYGGNALESRIPAIT